MPEPPLPAAYLPFSALLEEEAGELLQLDAPMWLTRAPGRLEILGGPAETPGAATLTVPLARSVYCAIQNREDQAIRIRTVLPASWGGSRLWEGETGTLYTRKGPPRSLQVLRQTFSEEQDAWMLRIVAAMLGLRRTRQLNTPKHGFQMIIWSRLPEGEGYGDKAAFATAVSLALKAGTGLAKKRVDGLQVAKAVVQGSREVLDENLPMSAAVTSALGRRGCALYMEHGVDPNMQWIPLPKQCAIAGFETGVGSPVPLEVRQAADVGASMGLAHLNAALKKDKKQTYGGWGQIAPGDFEGGLRDHVPTKETGADWLKRFRLADAETAETVDADHAYRERALSEHQVRETARVKRFVAQLSDYSRTMREGFLVEAGRCLLSSHRSFQEKCSINFEEADEFVELVKKEGRGQALFGARLSEGGGSGVVTVLAHQSGLQYLREYGRKYARRHKQGGHVVADSGDGGVLTGWWEGVLDSTDIELESVPVGDAEGSDAPAAAGSEPDKGDSEKSPVSNRRSR